MDHTKPAITPMPSSLLSKEERAAAKKARKEARRAQRRADAAAAVKVAEELGLKPDEVNIAAASSVAKRALPEPPSNLKPGAVTICLMYQYCEPSWSTKQHRKAIHEITQIATKHSITGRGRCAPEGLNCTLTGNANDMRAFCYALRDWNPMFEETDFKLTDNVDASARFRFFTLRKVDELVAYGLDGVKAPSLKRHSGKHLEAHEYHQQMQQKDTVIIDVRNAYESAIGHFQPPPNGAKLLKPKMRNSADFPGFLNQPETKKELQGKTVMMYCTGGIRCERATALLNQMTEAEEENGFRTKDVVMVRGGIERYLKTFPDGGYWKGKNYLFDMRREQIPEKKTLEEAARDLECHCCICLKPHSEYRGQFRCGQVLATTGLPCNVPVIVCTDPNCQSAGRSQPELLACPLCTTGYQPPADAPDLVGQKRKLGVIQNESDSVTGRKLELETKKKRKVTEPSSRLFVGRLPLKITASALRNALIRNLYPSNGREHGIVSTIQWIVDHDSRAFYGSAFCEIANIEDAKAIVASCTKNGGLQVGKSMQSRRKSEKIRRARVAFAPIKDREAWPPLDYCEREFPPIGI